jgi:hypothetical protein
LLIFISHPLNNLQKTTPRSQQSHCYREIGRNVASSPNPQGANKMNPLTERNRNNAQKSSGPRTPAGKARSAQNAIKTGLYSATALLPTEDPEEYRAHSESYAASLKPQDPVQADLVKILSDNVWCLRRIRGLVAVQTGQVRFLLTGGSRLFDRYVTETRLLESFSRHEHRLQNAIAKTLKLLKELQKEPPQEEALPETVETESGFVPTPQFATAAATATATQPAAENTQNPAAAPVLEDQSIAA